MLALKDGLHLFCHRYVMAFICALARIRLHAMGRNDVEPMKQSHQVVHFSWTLVCKEAFK